MTASHCGSAGAAHLPQNHHPGAVSSPLSAQHLLPAVDTFGSCTAPAPRGPPITPLSGPPRSLHAAQQRLGCARQDSAVQEAQAAHGASAALPSSAPSKHSRSCRALRLSTIGSTFSRQLAAGSEAGIAGGGGGGGGATPRLPGWGSCGP